VCAYRILAGKPEERENYEVIDLNGRIILKWILKKYDGGVYRIHLAQDRDQWLARINMIINLRVPIQFCVSSIRSTSQS
jgi:hypothetical protein